MPQDTSLEAWEDIRKNLRTRQQQVLSAFEKYGVCTNLEISHLTGIPINQVTPRTNELVKKNLIYEGKKRKCNVSGRKAITWSTHSSTYSQA